MTHPPEPQFTLPRWLPGKTFRARGWLTPVCCPAVALTEAVFPNSNSRTFSDAARVTWRPLHAPGVLGSMGQATRAQGRKQACWRVPRGPLPFCVGAVLGDDHLQLAEPAHWRPVGARGELQEEPLLLFGERVHDVPELPARRKDAADCTGCE